jgi:hypothetical protein
MNRQDLENRLRNDAERLQVSCPPQLRQRVAARLRAAKRRSDRWPVGFSALAGALGALVVMVSVWMLWQPPGVEDPTPRMMAGLNAAPVVASSDRLLASREAALENERQLLERDLRNLRDHVTATFDINPNG